MNTSVSQLPESPNITLANTQHDDKTTRIGDGILRIGCLASDGCGFIHTYLKCVSNRYNTMGTKARESMALSVRAGMSSRYAYDYNDSAYSRHTELKLPDPVSVEPMDISISGIIDHLMTTKPMSPYLFYEFAEIFRIGVIFAEVVGKDLRPIWVMGRSNMYMIMLPMTNWFTFELVGREGQQIQTAFPADDPLINGLISW